MFPNIRGISRHFRPVPFGVAAGTLALLLLLAAPASAQKRALRITLGYDGSKGEGYSSSGRFVFGGSGVTSSEGALRLGLSYDVYRTPSKRFAGLVYIDTSSALFSGLYTGFGIGVRSYLRESGGGYVGAGLGIYNMEMRPSSEQDNRGPGLKLSLGYETSGSIFFETGITFIAADGYGARPAFLLGFRF